MSTMQRDCVLETSSWAVHSVETLSPLLLWAHCHKDVPPYLIYNHAATCRHQWDKSRGVRNITFNEHLILVQSLQTREAGSLEKAIWRNGLKCRFLGPPAESLSGAWGHAFESAPLPAPAVPSGLGAATWTSSRSTTGSQRWCPKSCTDVLSC